MNYHPVLDSEGRPSIRQGQQGGEEVQVVRCQGPEGNLSWQPAEDIIGGLAGEPPAADHARDHDRAQDHDREAAEPDEEPEMPFWVTGQGNVAGCAGWFYGPALGLAALNGLLYLAGVELPPPGLQVLSGAVFFVGYLHFLSRWSKGRKRWELRQDLDRRAAGGGGDE